MAGGNWNPPRYKYASKLPFIPLESETDQLIAGCSRTVSTFLQLLKETAIGAGEAYGLKWQDIDFASATIRVTPEKSSNPRIFPLSRNSIAMLNALPRKSEKIFYYGSISGL